MAPMSTMNGRSTVIFTGRIFLRTTAMGSGLMDGGMYTADNGGIGGV
jgi:hypothetical protein